MTSRLSCRQYVEIILQLRDGALPWLKQKCASMLTSKTLLRKIETAEDWYLTGTWAGQVPMYLNIGREKVWF